MASSGSSAYLATTGSYQNQPATENTFGTPKRTRKRGLAATLVDATNLMELPAKRVCKEEAESMLASYKTAKKAPRGKSKAQGGDTFTRLGRDSVLNF